MGMESTCSCYDCFAEECNGEERGAHHYDRAFNGGGICATRGAHWPLMCLKAIRPLFMRISSTPCLQPPKSRSSRWSLSYGGPGSPCRTPRKSLRSSISQPYRRVLDKEKDKKSVQWQDEDDGGQQQQQLPAPPQALACPRLRCAVQDQKVSGKMDNSPNLSFLSSASADNMPLQRLNGMKRPRPSRLDPGFLKLKQGGSMMLGSLMEDDENTFPVKNRSTNSAA